MKAKATNWAEMLPFFRLGIGGRISNGRQWMSWITLHDEVEALMWLITADVEGPVNLTAPEPVSNRELTAALGRTLRQPAVLPTPKPALWAKLGRELTQALLNSSARVAPAVLQRGGFQSLTPTSPPRSPSASSGHRGMGAFGTAASWDQHRTGI